LPSALEDVDLARRVVDVVVATDHMGDGHVDVVHHHAEVVGGRAVGRAMTRSSSSSLLISMRPLTLSSHATTPPCGFLKRSTGCTPSGTGGRSCRARGARCRRSAAFPWRPSGAHAGRPARPRSCSRGRHGPRPAARPALLVAVHALHLVERAFVVVQAQPGHAFDDDVHRRLRGALQVGVFDAQDEVAASGARKGPGVQRRADVAQVDEAGGRRGKAGARVGSWRSAMEAAISYVQMCPGREQVGLDVVICSRPTATRISPG
jgi:hypothetical protein